MQKWIIRRFIKNSEDYQQENVRGQYGQLAGKVGIGVNLLLFASKLLVGTLFRSIAVTADAINNLSDAASSVVSLIGFRLSGKPADEDHPFGHARMEYIAAFVVAAMVMFIGAELLQSSIVQLFEPDDTVFSILTVIVLAGSILAKLWLLSFYRGIDKKIHSSVMVAAAADSLADVMTTSAVLLSALAAYIFEIQTDGLMGAAVALFILYAGFKILKETIDRMLGQGPTFKLKNDLEAIIREHEGVLGLHDLMVHDYGPNRAYASVHVEVDATVDILLSHDLIDDIERDILRDMGINLVIHLDPIVTNDKDANSMRNLTLELLREIDKDLTFHDFRMVKGQAHSNLIFDVVVPYKSKMNAHEIQERFQKLLAKKDKRLRCSITVDRGSADGAACS